MMKKSVTLLLVAALLLATLSFGGCNSSKEVPQDVLIRFIKSSEYFDTDYAISWTTTHSFNKSSNTDTVQITLTAESTYGEYSTDCIAIFEYNRASDLWSLSQADEWSEPIYTLNSNILGKWKIGSGVGNLLISDDKKYTINVTDISEDRITVDYSIQEEVYGGLYTGNVICKVSGNHTATIEDTHFDIPVTLPESFVAKNGLGGASSKTTDLSVYFSIDKGVLSALFDAQIYYIE